MGHRRSNRLWLTLSLLLAGVWPVEAATRYVSIGAGSDANSCAASQTIGTPKQNLTGVNGALNCMASGDTLLVRAGSYYDYIDDGDSNRDIAGGSAGAYTRVAAYPGETVWLMWSGVENYSIFLGFNGNSKYIEFDGINVDARAAPQEFQHQLFFTKCFTAQQGGHHIRFKNATTWGAPGYTPGVQGSPVSFSVHSETANRTTCPGGSEFQNLIIHGGGQTPPTAPEQITSYCFYITATETVVEHNEMIDARAECVQIAADGAAQSFIGRTVVRHNVIHGMHRGWSQGEAGITTGVMVGTGSDGAEIYNNVFYDNGREPYSSDVYCFDAINTKVYHNTSYGNTYAGVQIEGAYSCGNGSTVITDNIVYGSPVAVSLLNGATYSGSNNLFIGTDPLFVNAGANNFHLLVGSPAIDVGLCLAAVPTDYDGVTRPQGVGCDIGAYEFIAGGGGTPPGPVVGLVPANLATGIDLFPTLSWTAATGATSYDLFGPSLFNGQSVALLTDLWTIADSTDIGGQWTPYVIGYTNAQVVNQHVRTTSISTQSVERASVVVATDQWVRIRLTTMGTGSIGAGVLLRAQNSAQFNGYMAGATTGYGTYRTWVWRYDAGAAILLASEDTTPWASNDLLEAHIVGNVITIYRNGNTDLRLTGPADNTYTAGFVGLHLFSNVAIGQVEIDNFEAGSIGPTYTLSQAGITYPAVSLSPATVYYWKVIARNAFGSSDSGVVQFTTTGTTATPVGIRVRFKAP